MQPPEDDVVDAIVRTNQFVIEKNNLILKFNGKIRSRFIKH